MIKLSGENRYPTNERNGNIETGWYREENYSTSSLRRIVWDGVFFILKTQNGGKTMLDIKRIRENFEEVATALGNRGVDQRNSGRVT